jgi:hypothetical protein
VAPAGGCGERPVPPDLDGERSPRQGDDDLDPLPPEVVRARGSAVPREKCEDGD